MFNIRIKVLNSDIRSSVKGHYSAPLSSPPQITILIFVPKGIQNLLTIPNSRLLLSLSTFLLLLVLLAGSVVSQDPSELSTNQLTLPDSAQFIINVLKCSNTLQYKPHKRATKLIVTILTDINACNNNISINNKREGRITSCLGDDIYRFFNFTVFCFSWVLYYFLFGFIYILVFVWFYLYVWLESPHPSWFVNFRS